VAEDLIKLPLAAGYMLSFIYIFTKYMTNICKCRL